VAALPSSNIRSVWRAHVLCLFLVSACAPDPGSAPRFNVILISVDTLRADRLNCYGYDRHPVSPNVDALADDGIRFDAHISASPWTTPAHISLLTSLHPSTHGLMDSFSDTMRDVRRGTFNKLPEERQTLADALRDAGYATAAFTGGVTLDPAIGFDQGFDVYDTSMYKLNEYNVGAMLDWLDHQAERPFFLFWHTFEVHAPYLHGQLLPDDYAHLAPELAALATTHSRLEAHSRNAQAIKSFLREQDALVPEVCDALYTGGVESMDAWLGRFVDALRSSDLYHRTLIVFTSDHGDELADHDPESFYDKHGHSAYEEIIRVPLIVKLPEQDYAGTVVDKVSRAIDVMPTILDVAGVHLDASEMQGASLRPMWEAPSSQGGRIAFTEASATGAEIKSLRSDRFKYIVEIQPDVVGERGRAFVPDNPTSRKLFDLEDDPREVNDLLAGGGDTMEIVSHLELQMRMLTAGGQSATDEVELDEEALERLRALGYIQ